MNKLVLTRLFSLKGTKLSPGFSSQVYSFKRNKSSSSSSGSSSSSSTSDDESGISSKDPKRRNEEALKKLNALLQKIVTEDITNSGKKLELAQPKNRIKQKNANKENTSTESVKLQSTEQRMVNAAKDVAQTIGGDVKQTESELIAKLLDMNTRREMGENSLSDVIKGMKVEKKETPQEQVVEGYRGRKFGRGAQRFGVVSKERLVDSPRDIQKIDLFGAEPLRIFSTDQSQSSEGVVNKTWKYLQERELKLAVTHPPSNYFQQMILWTEQGKVWQFPIDNEQGLDEEKKVPFTEHIFLDKHWRPWCPPKGPICHFMEVLCVGLSKNSFLTVQEKIEHIEWFRNYFQTHKKLLQESNAIPPNHDFGVEVKHIEK